MPPLRVPTEFADVAVVLARLKSAEFDQLVSVLGSKGPHAESGAIDRRSVASAIDDLTLTDMFTGAQLLNILLALTGLREEARVEDAADIAAALADSPDLPADVARDALSERVGELLRTQCVELLGRGVDLLAENEHLLVGARIVSEIRPLFNKKRPSQIDGTVIGHTLRLNFARGWPESIDVALDYEDLGRLRTTLDRALDKEIALRSLAAQSSQLLVHPYGGDAP